MTTALIEALHHHANSRPESVAFRISKDVWTYKRLAVEVERLARGLVKRGLREGNRVALHMANVAELVVAYYACFRIGVVAAPLNTKLKFAELRPLLEQLQPALYIGRTLRTYRCARYSIIPSNARYIIGDSVDDPWVQSWRTLLEDGIAEPLGTEPNIDAPAVLLTTSGTTTGPNSPFIHRRHCQPSLLPRAAWNLMATRSQ
jgi:long-chain acyl-CoA synthetase